MSTSTYFRILPTHLQATEPKPLMKIVFKTPIPNPSIVSSREKEIIELLSLEFSTKEISEKLFISFETVKSHRKNIQQKLKVKNVAGIIREAFYQKILSTSMS